MKFLGQVLGPFVRSSKGFGFDSKLLSRVLGLNFSSVLSPVSDPLLGQVFGSSFLGTDSY